MTVGWLPREAAELFGEGAVASESYQVLTVDVPAAGWERALLAARDDLGCGFLDWLSAVDEPGSGLFVCAHVVALGRPPRKLLLRTSLPREGASLATATRVYRGAAWHERETAEMFGVDFAGHPGLRPLLLPEGFEGHPLRKDFVLAARVAKAWPGAKEPGEPGESGESGAREGAAPQARAGRAAGPRRRQSLPPGVPDPNEWGPRRGQLAPPPPAGQPGAGTPQGREDRPGPAAPRPAAGPRRPRRNRSAAQGSASQRQAQPPAPAEPGQGHAAPAARPPAARPQGPADPADPRGPAAPGERAGRPAPRTPDAPWHARPRPAGHPPDEAQAGTEGAPDEAQAGAEEAPGEEGR
ncbi:NADH-quinone oxidoreductase subunit C [Streptomyces hoynatensis]|uniref:NADH-quinone oxidoreductase n=1 Tax=Streptomyces hoynatensis TaxID=1141874 RepID=A0A3A9YT38_9ACTN|nr:NADH-quinone oxidoreductase subunit C [Streptomyces hoynatensis]RKN39232.1 NADH-quinone oxidoreductase subunit C [Streptomyces hoynatensis]